MCFTTADWKQFVLVLKISILIISTKYNSIVYKYLNTLFKMKEYDKTCIKCLILKIENKKIILKPWKITYF